MSINYTLLTDINNNLQYIREHSDPELARLAGSIAAKNMLKQLIERKGESLALPLNIDNLAFSSLATYTELKQIILSNTINSLNSNCFALTGLKMLYLPDACQTINQYAISSISSLQRIYFADMEVINNNSIIGCHNCILYDFTRNQQVPQLPAKDSVNPITIFTNFNANAKIVVPDCLYEDWHEAWSVSGIFTQNILDAITSESDYSNNNINYKHQKYDDSRMIYHLVDYENKYNIDLPIADKITELTKVYEHYYLKGFNYNQTIDEQEIQNQLAVFCSRRGYNSNVPYTSFTKANNFELPNDLTRIGDRAFQFFYRLQNIDIPSGVKEIGASSFSSCESLQSVSLPKAVTVIGDYAFSGCAQLSDVTIEAESELQTIGQYAFQSCPFSTIELPNSTTTLGTSAFHKCQNLESIVVPDSVVSIGNSLFHTCSNLKTATIGTGITTINTTMFQDCHELTNVTFLGDIKKIGIYSFTGCDNANLVIDFSNCTEIPLFMDYQGVIGKDVTFADLAPTARILVPPALYLDWITHEDWVHLADRIDVKATEGLEFSPVYENSEQVGYAVSRGSATDTYIAIPSAHNNLPVLEIGNFAEDEALEQIIIPNSVIKINDNAFYGCYNLQAVSMSKNITTIGKSAFYSCYSLREIQLPENLSSIKDSAFTYCLNLTNVKIPEGVTEIKTEAFAYCNGLKTIEIPTTINTLDPSILKGCDNIENITMPFVGSRSTTISWPYLGIIFGSPVVSPSSAVPESLKSITVTNTNTIGTKAFAGCGSIEQITLLSAVKTIGEDAFLNCAKLTSIEIPDTVTSIGAYAFNGCSSLTSVTIGNSVISIGSSAFSGCTSLTNITIPNSVTSIGYQAFYNCSSLTSIVIPDTVESIGDSAFYYCSSLESIAIPDSVTSIGNYAFRHCSSLMRVEIPDGVTNIGNGVFCDCASLTSIVIPDGVTSIGNAAFRECTSLTSIEIPSGVTSIDRDAFYHCTSLTSITIPDGVTNISVCLCSDCENLASITIGESVESIGASAFLGCTSLTSIEIPDSVTSIGKNAFRDCSGLTSITIPSGAMSIGDNAFEGCTSLETATIPALAISYIPQTSLKNVVITSGESISDEAFYCCASLTNIVISDSVTTIGRDAFYRCLNLASVEIGNGVTSIGNSAFNRCENLTSVEIPNSVTSIGDSAFSGCTRLSSVTLGNQLAEINSGVFEGCSDLMVIVIPDSVRSIGEKAFKSCSSLTILQLGNGVQTIQTEAFCNCSSLFSLNLPASIQRLSYWSFGGCYSLQLINYNGTLGDWLNIDKDSSWYYQIMATKVSLSDGMEVPISLQSIYYDKHIGSLLKAGDSLVDEQDFCSDSTGYNVYFYGLKNDHVNTISEIQINGAIQNSFEEGAKYCIILSYQNTVAISQADVVIEPEGNSATGEDGPWTITIPNGVKVDGIYINGYQDSGFHNIFAFGL